MLILIFVKPDFKNIQMDKNLQLQTRANENLKGLRSNHQELKSVVPSNTLTIDWEPLLQIFSSSLIIE